MRGVRPARSNILTELSTQDETITQHIQHINGQLGLLIDQLGKLEGLEQTSSGMKKLLKLRKKKSGTNGSKCDRSSPVDMETGDMVSSSTLTAMSTLSSSNPSLASLSLNTRPTSLPAPPNMGSGADSRANGGREDIVNLAIDIQADLATMQKEYLSKRDHIRQLVESDSKGSSLQPNMAVLASLRQALRASQEQNQTLRTRLARIHAESDISEVPAMVSMPETTTLPRGMNNTLSYSSSCMSEFFDAREYVNSGEDTDEEEMDDCESDASKDEDTEEEQQVFHDILPAKDKSPGDHETNNAVSPANVSTMDTFTGRRRELPVPITEMEGVNLWNLLCKNIGKDLSKISMPVTLNEPLSTLQRLCEELEYSDLVDKAVGAASPLDR